MLRPEDRYLALPFCPDCRVPGLAYEEDGMTAPEGTDQDAGSAREGRLLGVLIDESHVTPPSEIAGLIARHCAAAGLRDVLVQLQDYDQQQLLPVPLRGAPPVGPEPLAGSMAGRAFTSHSLLESERVDGFRIWAPMLDGTDRVGVLSVTADDASEATRRLVRRLAGVVADLIVTKGAYTDLFFQLRRRRPMSLQAEMQWHLLPPLVMITPEVSVAGALELAYDVGGDAFDYALNEGVLHVAIFDAMGHGLRAAMMAGVTTASYRHARRAAVTLEEIYDVMDRAVSEQFQPDEFVTATVAELDTATGLLRWVNAGHPPPLLIRGNQVVRPLSSEPTLPVGFGGAAPVVAQEQLQTGDRVLLFTDGVTEQRTRRGPRLGDSLFEDLVERELAADTLLAETLRRLIAALLGLAAGQGPDDDATLVLFEWNGPSRP